MIYRFKEPVKYITRFAIPQSMHDRFKEYQQTRQKPVAELCREALELLMANQE